MPIFPRKRYRNSSRDSEISANSETNSQSMRQQTRNKKTSQSASKVTFSNKLAPSSGVGVLETNCTDQNPVVVAYSAENSGAKRFKKDPINSLQRQSKLEFGDKKQKSGQKRKNSRDREAMEIDLTEDDQK